MRIFRRALIAACAVISASATAAASAQSWQPDRNITRVVSYPPGGDTDAMAWRYAEMLTGRVQMGYTTYGPVSQHIAAGKLVAEALTDPDRTPANVIQTRNAHMNDILRMPDVVEKMASFGARPVGGEPEDLSKINGDDFARLSKTAQDLKITAE